MTESRTITFEFVTHAGSGLVFGFSPEIKGLNVHGDSIEEVIARIPNAVREIIEAKGGTVSRVEYVSDDSPKGFAPSKARVTASYSWAA